MREVDLYGLIINTLLMGGLFTFLGWVMKSQNAGDMLNGFDEKKYDKDKVSAIVGKDFLYAGLLVIFLGVIGVFLDNQYYNYITFIQGGIVMIGVFKGMYHMYKKCRIKR